MSMPGAAGGLPERGAGGHGHGVAVDGQVDLWRIRSPRAWLFKDSFWQVHSATIDIRAWLDSA